MRNKALRGKSELLALFHAREKDIAKMPDVYRRPGWDVKQLDTIAFATKCVGEVETSDPFAAKRCENYMLHGLELPSEILKECRSRQALRRRQHEGSLVKTLQPLKRKLDEDRAWNQFHSKQYVEAAE